MQANVHCASSGADVDTSNSITSLARNNDSILDPIQSSGIQHLIETIRAQNAEPVISLRRNRKEQRAYGKIIYKERNLVERLYQKLKKFRRIATRYERLARNYPAMLYLASAIIWLD